MSKKFILGGIVALSLAILPSVASATTNSVEELQAMIASLLKQVQELQTKLAQVQGNNGVAWCHSFNKDIGVGSEGDDVYALSLVLQKEGFNLGKFDGYDENAASSVSALQEKYASEVLKPAGISHGTGYLGARTRAVLNRLYGCGNKPVSENGKVSKDINQYDPVAPSTFVLNAKVVSGATQIAGESKVTYTVSLSDSLSRSSGDWTLQIVCSADMVTNSKGGFDCGETNTVSGGNVEISFMNGTGKWQSVYAIAKLISNIDGSVLKTSTAKVELPPAY